MPWVDLVVVEKYTELHGYRVNINVTVISLHSVFWFNSYNRGFRKKFRHRQRLFLHSEIPWRWQELLVTETELLNHSSLRKYQQWINLATKWLFAMSALEKKSQTSKDNASVDFCHFVPNVEMLKPTTVTFFSFLATGCLRSAQL